MLGIKALTPTALLAIVFLSSSYSLFAQNPSLNSAATGSPAVRDPSALAVIERAISAAGGPALVRSIADFDAKGTITYHWADQDVPGQVEIKARGLDQVRMDVELKQQGHRSLLLSHGRGKESDQSGIRDIHAQNVRHMGLLIFVLPRLLEAIDNQQIGISLDGTEMFNERTVYVVRVVQALPGQKQLGENFQRLRTTHFLIDQSTLMVVGIRHLYRLNDRLGTILPREVSLGDFRSQSGLTFPFSMAEKQAGQELYAIHLTDVHWNVGLSTSDFQ